MLILVARGLSNQEVADGLHLSVETVRTHLKHIYTKSGARNRLQAVIAAFESGVVHLTPPGEARWVTCDGVGPPQPSRRVRGTG